MGNSNTQIQVAKVPEKIDGKLQLIPKAFNSKNWAPMSNQVKNDSNFTELKFVTYNIWFETTIDSKMRFRGLFDIMKKSNAHFICLQEVIISFLRPLLEENWVKENYIVSDTEGKTVIPYGVLLLIRKDVALQEIAIHDLPTGMSRFALIATCFVNGKKLKVCTVHLESLDFNVEFRTKQMDLIIKKMLIDSDSSFFMGDFNFDSAPDTIHAPQQAYLEEFKDYLDAWVFLNNESPHTPTIGITYPDPKYKPARFDRVLVRSREWEPSEIALVGSETLGKNEMDKNVFPSDHLGIIASFKVKL